MIDGQAVAPLIVQTIGDWSDTLSTLGLAINGGIAALSVQIFLHNQNSEQPPLRLPAFALICFGLQGIKILLGFLVHSSLIAGVPTLLSAQYESGRSIEYNTIPVLDRVQSFAVWQFVTFIVGFLFLSALIPFNWKTLRGKR